MNGIDKYSPFRFNILNVIHIYYDNGLFWMRINGFGIYIKNGYKTDLLFSERSGHGKGIKVGKIYVGLLD